MGGSNQPAAPAVTPIMQPKAAAGVVTPLNQQMLRRRLSRGIEADGPAGNSLGGDNGGPGAMGVNVAGGSLI